MKMEILQGTLWFQINFLHPRLARSSLNASHAKEIVNFPEDVRVKTCLLFCASKSSENWSAVSGTESIHLHTLMYVFRTQVEPFEPYLDCTKLAHNEHEL